MIWLLISVPFMLLGIAAAVLPVTIGTIRQHRAERKLAAPVVYGFELEREVAEVDRAA